jgi:hypothetical protein
MRFRPEQQTIEVLTWHVDGGFLVESTRHVEDREAHRFSVDWRVGE